SFGGARARATRPGHRRPGGPAACSWLRDSTGRPRGWNLSRIGSRKTTRSGLPGPESYGRNLWMSPSHERAAYLPPGPVGRTPAGQRRRGRNAAMLSVVVDDQARAELTLDLDELFREGARRMLAVALEAEVEAYIAGHAELVDEDGHRLVVRNGHAPARTITTGVGQVEVVRPRVDDRRVDPASGQRVQFHSGLLPRWCRRSPKVAEVLPLLYLHG